VGSWTTSKTDRLKESEGKSGERAEGERGNYAEKWDVLEAEGSFFKTLGIQMKCIGNESERGRREEGKGVVEKGTGGRDDKSEKKKEGGRAFNV